MSYGFYKLPPGSSHEDYIAKVAGKTPIAIGIAVTDHTTELQPAQPDTVTLDGTVTAFFESKELYDSVIQGNVVVDNTPNIPGDDLGMSLEPPKVDETLTQREKSLAQGYSGDICDNCQGARLRWAGHCKVCDDCGTTTGCS